MMVFVLLELLFLFKSFVMLYKVSHLRSEERRVGKEC